ALPICRLAGAVRADQADQRSRLEAQRDAVEYSLAEVRAGDVVDLQRFHPRSFLASTSKKNGPPTIAVIKPSGISAGGSAARAMPSQTMTTAAPIAALTGINRR